MDRYRRRHDRHTPRTWFGLFLRLGGWAAVALAAVLLVVTFFSASALFVADTFDRKGHLAYGTVAAKRIAKAEGPDGKAAYLVSFTYKVRGEPGRTVETEVARAYYDGVDVGDERPIRYLAADPGVIEEDAEAYRRTGEALRWLGLAAGLAGLAALWLTGSRAALAIRVRRDGDKRIAEVTAIRELRVRVGGVRQGRLVWREPDGHVGESLMRNGAWLRDHYRPGDRIVVFRRGRHAFWEGDVGPPRRELPGVPPQR